MGSVWTDPAKLRDLLSLTLRCHRLFDVSESEVSLNERRFYAI